MAVKVTIAEELLDEIITLAGDTAESVWSEIRQIQVTPEIWDVWLESPGGPSLSVSIAEHSEMVRILCDAFVFEPVRRAAAGELAAALLTGDFTVVVMGRFSRSVVLEVVADRERWTARRSFGQGLSDWEQSRLRTL